MYTSALIANTAYVTIGVTEAMLRGRSTRCLPTHSGQRCPTGVGVMHSAQIGRPHCEHSSPVSRSGCR
jgi:hypothetical protein